MNSIWKYVLQATDDQIVEMPARAEILSVNEQGREVCMWAMVDPNEEEKEQRKIRIHGTGHPIRDAGNLKFIGTVLSLDGMLVWHVFENLGG